MPRRALRKIDPALDLSQHYREAAGLPPRFDPLVIFGRTAPLHIEVGSGKGLFLASASQATPDSDFLGLEIVDKYARFAAARSAKQSRANARVICGDALVLFRDWFPPESAAAVHVYFPDPWWKKRHRKRRVMTAEFLRNVERTLVAGGELHFWTDVEEYFQETLALISSLGFFSGPHEVPVLSPAHDLDYRTHFERRMRQQDLPVYRAEFRKA